MTKPDEELGLDPVLFANRLEKRFEATTRCSFCWQLSPQTKRMVKSINDDSAICDACVNTLAAALPNFYAARRKMTRVRSASSVTGLHLKYTA